MLYAEEGLPIPDPATDDVYTLEGFPEGTRAVVKKMLQIILNSKNPISAIKTIAKHCPKENYPEVFEKHSYEDIVRAFEDKHRGIIHHFYSGCGVALQKKDSQIAESVMLKLAESDMPVLCVHDSFIVRRDHEEALIDAMTAAVHEMYGVNFYDKADKSAYEFTYEFLRRNINDEDLPKTVEKYETRWTDKEICSEYFDRLKDWEQEKGVRLLPV